MRDILLNYAAMYPDVGYIQGRENLPNLISFTSGRRVGPRYRTRHFHLFVCVAIVSIYGPDIISQKLPHDEILLYFSSLANHMDARVVLKKARGLLHHFVNREKIPCSLAGVVESSGMSQWDSHKKLQAYECVSR
ncbi:unnamed protein product, partial [Mesorhabditis spiculigera]